MRKQCIQLNISESWERHTRLPFHKHPNLNRVVQDSHVYWKDVLPGSPNEPEGPLHARGTQAQRRMQTRRSREPPLTALLEQGCPVPLMTAMGREEGPWLHRFPGPALLPRICTRTAPKEPHWDLESFRQQRPALWPTMRKEARLLKVWSERCMGKCCDL